MAKITIPSPRSEFVKIARDEITGEFKAELAPEWYLYFSQRDWADEDNILANDIFGE
jgi:hypothetical protein